MSADADQAGQCDTPRCSGQAETVTPDGYVCRNCALQLEEHYREAERRDRRADR